MPEGQVHVTPSCVYCVCPMTCVAVKTGLILSSVPIFDVMPPMQGCLRFRR